MVDIFKQIAIWFSSQQIVFNYWQIANQINDLHRSPTKKQKPAVANAKFPNDFFGTNTGIEVRSKQMSQR